MRECRWCGKSLMAIRHLDQFCNHSCYENWKMRQVDGSYHEESGLWTDAVSRCFIITSDIEWGVIYSRAGERTHEEEEEKEKEEETKARRHKTS